jgi:hypothetical protein
VRLEEQHRVDDPDIEVAGDLPDHDPVLQEDVAREPIGVIEVSQPGLQLSRLDLDDAQVVWGDRGGRIFLDGLREGAPRRRVRPRSRA